MAIPAAVDERYESLSAWTELRDGIRSVILMQERLERLTTGAERMANLLAEHDRRLVRIETMIELAQASRLAKESS